MSETVNPTVGALAPSYAMEGEEFEDAKDTSAPELRGESPPPVPADQHSSDTVDGASDDAQSDAELSVESSEEDAAAILNLLRDASRYEPEPEPEPEPEDLRVVKGACCACCRLDVCGLPTRTDSAGSRFLPRRRPVVRLRGRRADGARARGRRGQALGPHRRHAARTHG